MLNRIESLSKKRKNVKKIKRIKLKKSIPIGTVRIDAKTLRLFEKTKTSWKRSSLKFSELLNVVKLFKSNKKFDYLIDTKNTRFLKGQLSNEGIAQGARINILPNGKVLDKAYSLFAKHLTIHDQDSHDHWDVIYQNKGGTWSYLYTKEKKAKHVNKKYKKVEAFARVYGKLEKKVTLALNDNKDTLAIPMYTLLKTKMRIGNEIYYKTHHHKGLTTLKKKDISIKGKKVKFDYIGKDGVPQIIEQEFPSTYIRRLKLLMKPLKPHHFVFADNGHPLQEKHFKQAFLKYCGQEFYPHIVRSFYATNKVKEFLQKNKSFTKKEMQELLYSIAASLGHKKFVKKEQVWKESFNVTLNNYVQPSLVEKLKKGRIR